MRPLPPLGLPPRTLHLGCRAAAQGQQQMMQPQAGQWFEYLAETDADLLAGASPPGYGLVASPRLGTKYATNCPNGSKSGGPNTSGKRKT